MRPIKYGPFLRFGASFVQHTLGRYLSVTCKGLANLPRDQPFILASNHVSILDPILLSAYVMPRVNKVLSPAATKGLFVWPLKPLFVHMGAFVVDRQTKRNTRSVRHILKTLQSRPILIFPEGGVTTQGEKRQTQQGVGFLAKKSGVPVIPTVVLGTEQALPKGARWVRRRPVTLVFGPALTFGGDAENMTLAAIAQAVMDAIELLKVKADSLD